MTNIIEILQRKEDRTIVTDEDVWYRLDNGLHHPEDTLTLWTHLKIVGVSKG
jgi:hypothetical protein